MMAEGADPNTNYVGLDVSDVIDGVRKANASFDSFNQHVDAVAKALEALGGASDINTVKLAAQNATLDKLAVTLRGVRDEEGSLTGEWEAANRTLTLVTQKTRENIEAREQAIKAAKALAKAEVDLASDLAKIRERQEADIKAVTDEMQHQANVLAAVEKSDVEQTAKAAARARTDRTGDLAKIAEKQIADIKAVTDEMQHQADVLAVVEKLRARAIQQQAEERAEQARERVESGRARLAERLGGRLQRGFVTPAPATPEEVANVTRSIAQITKAVESGSISYARAIDVIKAAQAGSAEVFTGTERQVADASIRLQAASKNLGQQFVQDMEKTGDAGKKSAQVVLISWQSLARLFIYQTIHIGLRKLFEELTRATDEAAKFSIRIAEIQTIAQGSIQGFADWAGAVRNLSDQFGQPISSVAEGLYQTLSSQLAQGTDATKFLAEAMKFGRVAILDTEKSVNLLSGALNAYGLSADNVQRVSAIFFETIRLGKVRAEDLSSGFGNVASLAAPLGISLEEVNAAIATLTIQGVKPQVALTLLNNIFIRLLKPTKEMKDLLNSMGYASGEAAKGALGLSGILKVFAERAAQGEAAVVDLFGELRSSRGVFGLAGNEFERFASNLEQIKQAASGTKFDIADQLIQQSSGYRFQVEINRIKNILITDFGTPVINFLADLGYRTDAAGNRIHGLADSFRSLISVLIEAGSAWILYKVAILSAATYTKLLTVWQTASTALSVAQAAGYNRVTASLITAKNAISGIQLSGTAAFTILGTAAIAIWQIHEEAVGRAERVWSDFEAQVGEIVERETKVYKANLAEQGRLLKEAIGERFSAQERYVADVIKLNNLIIENISKNQKDVAKDLHATFDLYVKDIERQIRDLETASRTALENMRRAEQQIADLQEGLIRGRFERETALLPPEQQPAAYIKRISDLQNEAQRRLQARGTPETSKENLAQATKDFAEADRLTNDVFRQRQDLLRKEQELRERIKKVQEEQNQQEERATDTAKTTALQEQLRARQTTARRGRTPDLQTAALRRQLEESRNQARTDVQVGGEARTGERLDDLKKQLATVDATIKALGDQKDFEKQITDENEKRLQLLKDYAEAQRQIQTDTEKQVDTQRKQLEVTREYIGELAAFKLPTLKPDITASQAANVFQDALADFDIKFRLAIQKGHLTDQSVILAIIKQEQDLRLEAEAKVREKILADQQNTIEKWKVQYFKAIDDINSKLGQAADIQTKDFTALLTFATQIQETVTANNRAAAVGAKVGIDITGVKSVLDDFRKEVARFKVEPTQRNADIVRFLIQDLVKQTTRYGPTGPAGILFSSGVSASNVQVAPTGGGATGLEALTLQDIQTKAQNALNQILKATTTQADLEKQIVTIRADAQAKGIDLQGKLNQTTADMTKANEDYVAITRKIIQELEGLGAAIHTANEGLQQLGRQPGPTTRPTSFNPNISRPTPNFEGVASNNQTVQFGDINVTVQSTGSNQMDGLAIARAVQTELRRGTITLRA